MTHISNGKSKASNGKKAPQPVEWQPASRSDITGKMRSEHESHRKITRAAAVAEGDDLIQFPQSQIVDESVSPSLREASRFFPSPNFPAKRDGWSGSGREQGEEAGYCTRVPQSARKRDFRLERHSNWKIHILVRGRGHHRQRGADGPFPSPPRLRSDSESELIFLSPNQPSYKFQEGKEHTSTRDLIKAALESRCT